MKKKTNKINLIKKICFIGITIYVMCIFLNQQKTLNSYKASQEYYQEEIETKLAYQETLKETKSNINSEEYIEEVAREKLDMYLPNEKVYIDKNK
ncbi:MAG: septum formation initiator family protein [Clostridia bacterium]